MLDKKDSVLAHSILFHFWQVLKQLFKEEEISITSLPSTSSPTYTLQSGGGRRAISEWGP
jgi:hypothetical protein